MRFVWALMLCIGLCSANMPNKAFSSFDTLQILAKLMTIESKNGIYIAEYQVIKVLDGIYEGNILRVYHYQTVNSPDTVLLTLHTHTNSTEKIYFFPNYNIQKGIEKVSISTISFQYWLSCEAGECEALTLPRNSKTERFFLIMPCGGTATRVTLTTSEKNEIIQASSVTARQCPPVFELTALIDGKYFASMAACGLGGQIEINLITKP